VLNAGIQIPKKPKPLAPAPRLTLWVPGIVATVVSLLFLAVLAVV
jgi:hypothetical protein